MGKCTFQLDWLKKQDCNGYEISEWLTTKDKNAFCLVCDKTVNIAKGFYGVQQHAEGAKHKQNCSDKIKSSKITLDGCKGESSGTIKIYNVIESVYAAEVMWALKVVSSNYAASSCDDIGDIFRKMFSGDVPEKFSLSHTKLSYLVTEALYPYFRDKMLEEARSTCYSLQYDETTNNVSQKELQVRVQFWSPKLNLIVSHHLESFFLGHATANDLSCNIIQALRNADLPLNKLVSLSSDGPNVNKATFKLVNEEVLLIRDKGLLEMGTCAIHSIHNSFLKGLNEFGCDVSDLILSVYYYFHGWPARCEDFATIQKKMSLPPHRFLKHVSSRWLTMEPAANRLLEQWPALIEYFLKFVPTKGGQNELRNARYQSIAKYLKDKSMKCEVLFVVSSAHMFTRVTGWFQKPEPMIHLLYSQLKDLVIRIAGRICTKHAIKNFSSDVNENPFEDVENLIPVADIILEESLQREVLKLTEINRLSFLSNVQKHYKASGKYVMNKNLLSNANLKYFRSLNPMKINDSHSERDVAKLAVKLPIDVKIDELIVEWKLCGLEKVELKEPERIDVFWGKVINTKLDNGEPKYKHLTSFVKAALCVYHGSAEVEREFSLSAEVLSEKKTQMKVRMLNSRLMVKDSLNKYYNNQPAQVPVTKQLISLARTAHKSYQNYLEDEKKKREEEESLAKRQAEEIAQEKANIEKAKEKKNEIQVLEGRLKEVKKNVAVQSEVSDKLLEEGNSRLKTALSKGDMKEAKIAQTIISAAISQMEETKGKEKEATSIQNKIGKRKNSLISSFFQKKPKQVI